MIKKRKIGYGCLLLFFLHICTMMKICAWVRTWWPLNIVLRANAELNIYHASELKQHIDFRHLALHGLYIVCPFSLVIILSVLLRLKASYFIFSYSSVGTGFIMECMWLRKHFAHAGEESKLSGVFTTKEIQYLQIKPWPLLVELMLTSFSTVVGR